MDVTWDAKKYQEYDDFSYCYFALNDPDIAKDHGWDKNTTPVCSHDDLSYFIKNGLFSHTMSQCSDIISTSVKKRTGFTRLKVSHNVALPKNAGDHLIQIVMDEAGRNGISGKFEYYWNEHNRCFYSKFLD